MQWLYEVFQEWVSPSGFKIIFFAIFMIALEYTSSLTGVSGFYYVGAYWIIIVEESEH